MPRAFFFLLSLLVGIITIGCSEPQNYGIVDGAPVYNRCADPVERTIAKEQYETDMFQDYLGRELSEAGAEWTLEYLNNYESAGIFARCRNTDAEVPVLINYYGGIGSRDHFFKNASTEEEELVQEEIFRQLMEKLMEEYFPGYNFFLTFNREGRWVSGEEAAFIIHVAYDEDRASYAAGKEVFLIHPTIIGHEAGHLCPTPEDENGFCMGFAHHYWGDNIDDHSHGPPEEDEGTCIMYRTGNTFGRTESVAALLQYDPDATNRIQILNDQIRAMLSDETNARSAGIAKCGTFTSDSVTQKD